MDLNSVLASDLISNSKTPFGWVAILLLSLVCVLILKLVLGFFSSRLRKVTSRNDIIWDDVAMDLVDGLRGWVLLIWLLFIISKATNPHPFVQKTLLFMTVAASTYQVGLWGLHIIKTWRQSTLQRRIVADPSSAAALGLLYTVVQALFLIFVVLIALSNLGVNIGALLAGLGVGGIAVALAAQNVLGDLMASLSIVLDKPFVVGDFIITGSHLGTVENIGIKTTRLRALSGEQLIFSNKDLIESRIQNYKTMWQRRVVQSFGVAYTTRADALEQIPKWVKGFIEKHPKLKFDRCHFAKYGASSLDFEFVFYVADPDYNVFMDLQQTVLIDLFRKLEAENIRFALPTQNLQITSLPMPSQQRQPEM